MAPDLILETDHDLPVEILEHIFRFLHRDLTRATDAADFNYKGTLLTGDTSLFPYSLASVCSLWRQVMSGIPEFWTRLIIYIDAFQLSQTQQALEWSQGHPVRLTVTQMGNAATLSPEAERHILKDIMRVIHHHIPRCEILRFTTAYSSSLPRITSDLLIVAPALTELCLNAFTSNGIGRFSNEPLCRTEIFQFPKLAKLTLDGWNFVDLFNRERSWFHQFLETSQDIHHLYISCYRSSNESDRFDFTPALRYVGYFTELELENLDYDISPDWVDEDEELQVDVLKLTAVSSNFASGLIGAVRPFFLHLHGVSLQSIVFECVLELHLSNIDYPGLSHDLRKLLTIWDRGLYLEIDSCLGFDDSVLEVLASFQQSESYIYHVPKLGTLTLKNCNGYSMQMLCRMVKVRRKFYDNYYHLNGPYTHSGPLVVRVEGDSILSEEDKSWLKEMARKPPPARTSVGFGCWGPG
ncbi:hypothetical protein H0H87_012796 [Tephrocybe sp. NHM501043]|nr:hypothetical protein H0H87_012796 [Tephrocybe sp. NHM501043]